MKLMVMKITCSEVPAAYLADDADELVLGAVADTDAYEAWNEAVFDSKERADAKHVAYRSAVNNLFNALLETGVVTEQDRVPLLATFDDAAPVVETCPVGSYGMKNTIVFEYDPLPIRLQPANVVVMSVQ